MKIKRHRLFFSVGDGESEQSYAAFLRILCEEKGERVNVINPLIKRGGNTLKMAEEAIKVSKAREEKGINFIAKVFFLDTDLFVGLDEDVKSRIKRILGRENFIIVWQSPDHEAFLYRHCVGCETKRPATNTMKILRGKWNNYKEGMTAIEIRKMFSLEDVRRASPHNPELKAVLIKLGLVK